MDSTEGAQTSVRERAGERKSLPAILIGVALGVLIAPAGALANHTLTSPPSDGFAPMNDHYLQSVPVNDPGARNPRDRRISAHEDVRNTAMATVQSDVFNPDAEGGPGSGGPAEPTTCNGTSYGNTVWYDFYPHVTGRVGIVAAGFDTVIRVVPFSPRTLAPNFARSQCVNERSTTSEVFEAIVRKGRAYTVQLGGVNGATGNLEFEIFFRADQDLDGVLGREDDCPRFKGPARRDGCPLRLNTNTTLRAFGGANGIRLDRLTVSNNRKARVEVRCRGCGRQVKRGKSVRFPRLAGRELPAGTKLEVRVSRRGAIGAYIAYRIQRGNFKKGPERCMNPGSRKPRRRCG
jgi:hypothetical protein